MNKQHIFFIYCMSIFLALYFVPLYAHATQNNLAAASSTPVPSIPFVPDDAYLTDRQHLDSLQHDAFLYMWEHSHPVSGMVYEATFHWDVTPVATGATGFGVAALISAVERGWVSREQAMHRLMNIVLFLRDKSPRKQLHGAFPHWLHGETGHIIPFSASDTGADLVETALLMQGLLLARQYFNGPGIEADLRAAITEIWQDIDWNWFTNGEENGLYWHWNAQKGFSQSLKILGNNECLIVYILALASPTHAISRTTYDYWTSGQGYKPKTVYGYTIQASLFGGGPLFLAQYSFIGLNPYDMADTYVEDGYFVRNVKHTLSNRGYSLYTAPTANKYAQDYWGLTASKVKHGYAANEPKKDRATVAPTAALASMPYTPHYSMQVLEALRGKYKDTMWGPWGPYDAFSLRYAWYSKDYLGINQLPMVCMVENYRTKLLWRLFMQDAQIRKALTIAGIGKPKHKEGFPEVIQALTWKSNKYQLEPYDIRRHPDTGKYHIPYWVHEQGLVQLELFDHAQNLVLTQTVLAHKGRNSIDFAQCVPPTTTTFTLTLTTKNHKKYSLPVRLY